MRVKIVASEQVMGCEAAKIVQDEVARNPKAVLMLPTGGTPEAMYEHLARAYSQGRVTFARVTTFNLDEYVGLSVEHPQSYHCYMQDRFFCHVDLPPINAHLLDGNAANLAKECRDFEQKIAEAGGVDLAVLGLGRNAHIAFNEPPANLTSRTHVAMLTESTRQANARFFGGTGDVPCRALTAGIATIIDCRKILVLACGIQKAEAVARAIERPVSAMCPASALQVHHKVTFLVDEAAASCLHFKSNYRYLEQARRSLEVGR